MTTDRRITRWGENASGANMADPLLAQELAGYANNQKPPNGELNWLLRQLALYHPQEFKDQRDAVATLPVGRLGVVGPLVISGDFSAGSPEPPSGHAWDKVERFDLTTHGNAVACDADLVFVGNDDGDMFAYTPDGVLVWTNDALPGAGTFKARSICADGDAVYCFRGVNDFLKINRLTGAVIAQALTTFTTLEAVVSSGEHLFVVGTDVNGAGATLARVNKTTLAIINAVTVDGAAIVRDVCYHDGLVWVTHDRGTDDAVVAVFDEILGAGPTACRYANANADGRAIVATPHGVFVGLTSDATNLYNVVALPLRGAAYTGTTPLWTGRAATATPLPTVWDMDWDGDSTLVVATVYDGTYGSFRVYDLRTGSVLREVDLGAGLDARGVACDLWRTYVVNEETVGGFGVHFYNASERARVVRRQDGTSRYRPRPHLLTL